MAAHARRAVAPQWPAQVRCWKRLLAAVCALKPNAAGSTIRSFVISNSVHAVAIMCAARAVDSPGRERSRLGATDQNNRQRGGNGEEAVRHRHSVSTTTARSTWPSSTPATRSPRSRGARRWSCSSVRPRPPALNLFDAGMGDGTVLSRIMRYAHSRASHGADGGRGQGDQPRGRATGPGQDARPLQRASGHGAGDHQPQLHRCATTDAARYAAGRGAQLAGSEAQG